VDNFSRLVPHPPAPPQPATKRGSELLEKIKAMLAKKTVEKEPENREPGSDDE